MLVNAVTKRQKLKTLNTKIIIQKGAIEYFQQNSVQKVWHFIPASPWRNAGLRMGPLCPFVCRPIHPTLLGSLVWVICSSNFFYSCICKLDHSKALLLLWIIFVIYFLCLYCFLVFSLQPCGHLLGKGWPLGLLVIEVILCFVTFPCGVLGQVLCLIVLIQGLIFTFLLSLYNNCSHIEDVHLLYSLHI